MQDTDDFIVVIILVTVLDILFPPFFVLALPVVYFLKVAWDDAFDPRSKATQYFLGVVLLTICTIQWSFPGWLSLWLHFAKAIFGANSVWASFLNNFNNGALSGQWWQAVIVTPVYYLLFRYFRYQKA